MILLAMAILAFAGLAVGQQFQFSDVSIPGAEITTVYAINSSNVMVGTYQSQTGAFNGFMLSGKTVTTIDDPNGTETYCFGINDSGEIVGEYFTAAGVFQAFSYNNGVFSDISFPGAPYTLWASGINSAGEIVGAYIDQNLNQDGFLFDGTSYETLDVPGALVTGAWGINDSGSVTLQWATDTTQGSSLYNGSTYTELSVPSSVYTWAYGIDKQGIVAVIWEDSFENRHCDLRLTNGTYLDADDSSGEQTQCFDINNRSVFVGDVEVGTQRKQAGFRAVTSRGTSQATAAQ